MCIKISVSVLPKETKKRIYEDIIHDKKNSFMN